MRFYIVKRWSCCISFCLFFFIFCGGFVLSFELVKIFIIVDWCNMYFYLLEFWFFVLCLILIFGVNKYIIKNGNRVLLVRLYFIIFVSKFVSWIRKYRKRIFSFKIWLVWEYFFEFNGFWILKFLLNVFSYWFVFEDFF